MTAFESPDIQEVDGAAVTAPTHANHANHEHSGHALVARVLAELAGSFFICLAIYLICSFGTAIYQVNMAFIALGIGVTYATVTTMLGGISGGQFNPAVTVAAMLSSKTRPVDGVLYIIAQVLGAIGAGAVLRFLLPTSEQVTTKIWLIPAVNGFENGSVAYSTVNQVGLSLGIVLAIVVEVVASLLIAGTAMRSLDEDGRPSKDYASAMGLAYGLGAAITYPVTGAALNPARATGIAVFAQGQGLNTEPLGQLWVFWVCPILAAAVVALVMIVSQMAAEAANKTKSSTSSEEEPEDNVQDASDEMLFAIDRESVQSGDAEVRDEQAGTQSDADKGIERD